MYAIVRAGGHQYRVSEGETVDVELLSTPIGESIELHEVLLVGGHDVRVGTPFVDGAVVRATVVADVAGPKLTIMKYKRKNRYRVKTGHRQRRTRLHIDAIEG